MKSERWLVSYADLMTLLFAVFTVLFALTQQDSSLREAHQNHLSGLFSDEQSEHESAEMLSSTPKVDMYSGFDFFDSINSAQLSSKGIALINKVRKQYQGADAELVIRCYLGNEQGGLSNSARQCAIIGDSLLQRGISAQRLQVIAMGERDPVASNLTVDSALNNFRVVIESQ